MNFFYWQSEVSSFPESDHLAISRLKKDWLQMVQSDELLRTKKKQTYLISREKEDFQWRLFYWQREVSSFPESDHFEHIFLSPLLLSLW